MNQEAESMNRLEEVLSRVVENLEQGRSEIFDIAEECNQQAAAIEIELQDMNSKIAMVIAQEEKTEKLERQARLRLMEVSRGFRSFSEINIRDAYDKAHELQMKLAELKQQEIYLRRQRDDMSRQLQRFRNIAARADRFLVSTAMALKILKGNVEKINDALEESFRKQQMELWIIESQEAERRRIARDLHDGPAQSLASILIRLDLIRQLWDEDPPSIYREIENIKNMGKETLGDIRRIMFDLKPSLFHEDSFSSTLKDYFNDYEAKYNFNIEFIVLGNIERYERSLEIALFRLVQEAITNVRKHSGVNQVKVKFEDTGSNLMLIIKDEGCGFDPENACDDRESYGIMGMVERVKLLGGELEIVSQIGAGTQVIVKVPLEGESRDGENSSSDRG